MGFDLPEQISGNLVKKLPKQIQKILGGKLVTFLTEVKSLFTGDTE
jgi:hypothetical protein